MSAAIDDASAAKRRLHHAVAIVAASWAVDTGLISMADEESDVNPPTPVRIPTPTPPSPATPSPSPSKIYTSSLTGEMRIQELMNGHPERIKSALGSSKETFAQLMDQLPFRPRKRISREEQLGIFLYVRRQRSATRDYDDAAERFQRDSKIVAR
ncbi:hypothetical protein P7C70_g1243, partial [Phenoliferia sp. Uapishka_3]